MNRSEEECGASIFERLSFELRARHYSPRTERAYQGWVQRFVLFHQPKHPSSLTASDLRAFLDDLLRRKVSASSHQQALCALQTLHSRAVRPLSPDRSAAALGHRDVATTMIYTHVLNRGPFSVRSPLD